MAAPTQLDVAAYRAARTGAAFFRVPDPGALLLTGPDRQSYIQRQTTNDIRRLRPDRTLQTVLTSGTARILDLWRLIELPEAEAIRILTLPGRGARMASYLARRIFFMDQVALRDESAALALFEVLGPQAGAIGAALGLAALPEPDALAQATVEGAPLQAIGLAGDALLLSIPTDAADALDTRLAAAGALALDGATREVLRVEQGQPGPAGELTDEFTPLDLNLDALIAGDKGCYSGQEVLARQITYDKITRRLAGLRCEGPVSVGDAVRVEGRSAGVLTSAVESPRLGWIALAVLRRPHHTPGVAVEVGPPGAGVRAATVALPFA